MALYLQIRIGRRKKSKIRWKHFHERGGAPYFRNEDTKHGRLGEKLACRHDTGEKERYKTNENYDKARGNMTSTTSVLTVWGHASVSFLDLEGQ